MCALGNLIIKFKDEVKITFKDIIELNNLQKSMILVKASKQTQKEIKDEKNGLKIDLEEEQKKEIVSKKEKSFAKMTLLEIYESKVVEFTAHSIDRMIQRYSGNQTDAFLAVIDWLKKANEVQKQAEWKGFQALSYTFLSKGKKAINKIVVTFVERNDNLKIITVMNDGEVDEMRHNLGEDDALREKLEHLKQQLKDTHKL